MPSNRWLMGLRFGILMPGFRSPATMKLSDTLDRLFNIGPEASISSASARQTISDSPPDKRSRQTAVVKAPAGLDNDTKGWLKAVLGELSTGIIESVNKVNEKTDQNKIDIDRVESNQDNMRASFNEDITALKQRCEASEKQNQLLAENARAMQLEIAQLRTQKSATSESGGSSTAPPPGLQSPTTPFNERTVFVLGRLGYDLTKDEAEEAGRKILTEAKAAPPGNLYAPFAYGSQIILQYPSWEIGNAAASKVRALNKKNAPCDEPVWMDVKKTTKELAPGKVLKAVTSVVESHYASCPNEERPAILPCTMSKRLYVNRKWCGNTAYGEWQWTQNGLTLLSPELRTKCEESAKKVNRGQ